MLAVYYYTYIMQVYTHIFSINIIGIYFPVWGGYGVGGSGWGDAYGKKS